MNKGTFIGKNVRFVRRLKGFSQTTLAEKVGLSRNNIASYESGVVEPSALNYLKICAALEIQPQLALEQDLSKDPNLNKKKYSVKETKDHVLGERFEEFTFETNQITKILEGYTTYYDFQRKRENDPQSLELYNYLDDVMELLRGLVANNWNLIQHINRSKSDEEE